MLKLPTDHVSDFRSSSADKPDIPVIADILKASSDELMTLWLADQIYAVVKDEKLANEAIMVAKKKINYKTDRRWQQTNLKN